MEKTKDKDVRRTRLVISRNEGESFWIGDVRVTRVDNRKFAIEAPEDVRVVREEIKDR